MEDDELIRRMLVKDVQAMTVFYKKYCPKLSAFIQARVADQREAEEIVHDALTSVLDSLPTFEGKSCFFTWMCGVARHEIGDFMRRKKIKHIVFSRLPFLKDIVSDALGPELAYQEVETKKRILRTLASLTEGYHEILRLKYMDDMSMSQIAEKLQITVKAVESRLTRARLAFIRNYDPKAASVRNSARD